MENTSPTLSLDTNACLRAVATRDPAWDGRFIYGVRTTGIYCRPSCPARKPRPDQIALFATVQDARLAGFRPCRRCQPDHPQTAQLELVERACRLIAQAETPPSLGDLGTALSVSPYHLQRVFKTATGLSPRQYAAGLRAGRFKDELRAGSKVTDAIYAAGFNSAGRLYAAAPSQLGMGPTTYRQGGSNMELRYTIVDCPLGRLLVAVTGRGIAAVYMGDDDENLEAMLRSEYPSAALSPDQPGGEVNAVLNYLQHQQPALNLPLDLRATAFQLRVWEELRRIPRGETRTYAQIAEAIGRPKAVRAVANACAANPAALVTPCHRVIRGDGGLGGYRWGIERKQRLLDDERPTR
jgi:AraC family transcriptional regulator of adaptative response/methylated-DNA-[protein]-cysteine methyltransferase